MFIPSLPFLSYLIGAGRNIRAGTGVTGCDSFVFCVSLISDRQAIRLTTASVSI
ncbi:hypothetical protein AAGG74_03420 [Bacillus mexicanus]|uniref:hypothetical protein n=1 Tax=Bacillus mexicanus TaxID=2834415 RepID=UPI003D2580B6